ncbi:hypothetical protein scyTo_0021841, partial [Scyliorhinus torazame]|nr:hypothetical protein [Scyliorhinus torazame]
GILSRASVGREKLEAAVAEGDKLVPHLPKPSAAQVQQLLANSQEEWQSFLRQCQQNRKTLTDYAEELTSFQSQHTKLSLWLHQAEQRMATESIGESKKNVPVMQVEVERMEDFYEEIQGQRDSFDSLCQKAQTLNELGDGDGGVTRLASQLLSQHQQLAKTVREKLRAGQLGLQEHQAFEETLQSTWSWLRVVQSKLGTIDSTVGSKTALEKQLLQIQEILLMKGEGEVKLNMTIGKGEQSLKSSNQEAGKAVHNQLQALREAWAEVDKVKKLEDMVQDHQQYNTAVQELTNWMTSAKEELHRWSDLSGDSTALQRKLKKVMELIASRRNGRERLNRVEALAGEVRQHTAANGCKAIGRELDALRTDWQQWEESTLQAQSGLENMLSQTTSSEQEFEAQAAQLDKDLQDFSATLGACSHSLSQLQDKTTDEEVVECWQKAKVCLGLM